MLVKAINHTRKISIPIGSIISDKPFTDNANPLRFFRVERIATVMYGSARRYVLLVLPLQRTSDLESSVAPYKDIVFAMEDQASIEVLPCRMSIQKISTLFAAML